jgi:hypothetical protein
MGNRAGSQVTLTQCHEQRDLLDAVWNKVRDLDAVEGQELPQEVGGGERKAGSGKLMKIMNSPGLGRGSTSFATGTLHRSCLNSGIIPAVMYGRRDSRVTFDLPQPSAAMDAFEARNE